MADLITLQQYKDFIGLQGVQQDARINIIIDSVSQLVKNYCGTNIIDHFSSAKTEYFVRSGSGIHMRKCPLRKYS